MTQLSYTTGQPSDLVGNANADMADIQGPFTDIQSFINGRNINADNMPVALLQAAGLNDTSGQKARGSSVIAAAGARTNTAYGSLSNGPDQVAGIVVPSNALVFLRFKAIWQESVVGAARAAIFIGANQLKNPAFNAAPAVQETAAMAGSANTDGPLYTVSHGLQSGNSTAATSDVTTGQTMMLAGTAGPDVVIENLTPGTYTFSVQFKASSGTVTVSNRRLYVEVRAY